MKYFYRDITKKEAIAIKKKELKDFKGVNVDKFESKLEGTILVTDLYNNVFEVWTNVDNTVPIHEYYSWRVKEEVKEDDRRI